MDTELEAKAVEAFERGLPLVGTAKEIGVS